MKADGNRRRRWCEALSNLGVAGLLTAAILAIFVFAPTEETMGPAQRILYVHVAMAWLGLLAFAVTAATGMMYLVRRDLWWDHWSLSAAELGWLCCGLTLLTGSCWARAAWHTWWTWDPRLTTSFVLWAICSGYLVVRSHLDDPHQRARLAAILAIVGVLDVPLVVLAAYWYRGMHPAAPQMEPAMRATLLLSVVAFSAFFSVLFVRRGAQLRQQCLVGLLQQRTDVQEITCGACRPPQTWPE